MQISLSVQRQIQLNAIIQVKRLSNREKEKRRWICTESPQKRKPCGDIKSISHNVTFVSMKSFILGSVPAEPATVDPIQSQVWFERECASFLRIPELHRTLVTRN